MKTNEKREGMARLARRSLVLVSLLVAALCFAGPSRAQSNAAPSPFPAVKSADAAVSQAQAAPAAPQSPRPATTAKPVAPGEKNSAPGAKGPHEGIAVHGHWTIEVKNPDGTVASHREFENAIANYDGPDVLTNILSGVWVTGGYYISLSGSNTGLCDGAGNCNLFDTRNTGSGCPATSFTAGTCGTLTYAPIPNTTDPKFTAGITLSGSVQPVNGGQISVVASYLSICSPTGAVPPFPTALFSLSPLTCGTAASGVGAEALTSTTIAGPAVNVITPQSVVVTVVITFGSS